MKNIKAKTLSIFAAIVALTSCENAATNDIMSSSVTGANGEVLVIMNDPVKNDTSGRYLVDLLSSDYLGLTAREPIFDVQTVPHPYFKDPMKKFRNIIRVTVNDTVSVDTLHYHPNIWAKPQAFIDIKAKTKEGLLNVIARNEISIVSYLTKFERERMVAFNQRIPNISLNDAIEKRHGIKINIPNTFRKCVPEHADQMTWVGINNDDSQIGLFVYELPYVGEGSLSKEYLLNKRDILLRDNVGGPNGSYMCTEIRFGLDEIIYKSGKYKGMEVAELRGQWRTEGYAMGGPFILRAHIDKENNRVVVTDGYVYYPSKSKKRNLVRQLEAIMYSLDIAKEENEK